MKDRTRRVLITPNSADYTMADFGPVGPLRIEEAMGANTGLPVQGFVPNGLLDCNLANQPSSSGQQRPPNCTPSSPVRQNESLDSSRAISGAYKCSLLLFLFT